MFYTVYTKVAFFWAFFCLFCFLDIVAGKLKIFRGKGTREEDLQEQRQNHMLLFVLWTEWAIAPLYVHFITPLHGMADTQHKSYV
jgi:hypothetical protein